MIERPDVDAMMRGELGEWLGRQGQVREEARQKSHSRLVKCAMIGLPVAGVLLVAPVISGNLKFFLIAAAAMFSAVWIYAPRAKAVRETKEGINSALARALGLEYFHDTTPGTGFERAVMFRMVPTFQRSGFEDLWTGTLAGRAFSMHEAHLQQKRSSGKNTHYVTVFQGPVMTMQFERSFHGTTLVERAGKHKKFGFFGEADDVSFKGIDLQKVDMVNPVFEDEFTIYSTDQVEARYLVHPTYVERLIALERAFAGQKIRTLFHEGEVTIVLEAKNMFESGHMDSGRDREMVETCVSQFMSMADLAAALNEERR